MTTYRVTFLAVIDSESAEDAVIEARALVSDPGFEPKVEYGTDLLNFQTFVDYTVEEHDKLHDDRFPDCAYCDAEASI